MAKNHTTVSVGAQIKLTLTFATVVLAASSLGSTNCAAKMVGRQPSQQTAPTLIPLVFDEAIDSVISGADIHRFKDALSKYGVTPSIDAYGLGAAERIYSFLHSPSTYAKYYYSGDGGRHEMTIDEKPSDSSVRAGIFNKVSEKFGVAVKTELEVQLMALSREDFQVIIDEAIASHPTKGVIPGGKLPSRSGITIPGLPADSTGISARIKSGIWNKLVISQETLLAVRPTAAEMAKSIQSDLNEYQSYRRMAEESRRNGFKNEAAYYQASADSHYERFIGELKNLKVGSPEMKVARAALVAAVEKIDGGISRLKGEIKEAELKGKVALASGLSDTLSTWRGDKLEVESYLGAFPAKTTGEAIAVATSKVTTKWQGRCEALLRYFTF